MILQALKEYYDRKAADSSSGIAPQGWESKEFLFVAEIGPDGKFRKFHDYGEPVRGKVRGKPFLVPSLGEKKGNGIKANLLWENIEYLFGIPMPTKMKPNPDPERVTEQHRAFCLRIRQLPGDCPTLSALREFAQVDNADAVQADPLWESVKKSNQAILLALGSAKPVTESEEIRAAVNSGTKGKGDGTCLVTGAADVITRLEPPIKGVYGDDHKAERSLVSFNLDSFLSFGRQKNFNAPIGKGVAFAYVTALNHLMGRDSRQKMPVGDATTVFWSAKDAALESDFAAFFDEPPKDDPDRNTKAVESLFKAPESGALVGDGVTKFYVLGLAPNASRIAVRFWIVDTVAGMSGKIRQHFEDIRIVHGPRDRDVLSLFRLLVSTATQGKAENIPPNVAGETMRAILAGLPYPQTLLQAAIRRIRAERDITYARAALIKACINRSTRFKNNNEKEELKVSLDENNTSIGYRLGRLFAALEKIQQEASPGINATIRDKFYGAASSTPVTVFGNLMRLKNHHLAKLENVGRRVNLERLLGQIMSGIGDFPRHLAMEEQGRFAIGYYHQMQDFYIRKSE